MVEAAQFVEPAMSFLGGALGAGTIWSFRARRERRNLHLKISVFLQEMEGHLERIYEAITTKDHKSAKASRTHLDRVGGMLAASLERYALVYKLSNRSATEIVKLAQLAKLPGALGKFADNYTLGKGKNSFGELMDLGMHEASAFAGTPDAINAIRSKFGIPALSEKVILAHAKAVALVEEDRDKLDSTRTKNVKIFLEDD